MVHYPHRRRHQHKHVVFGVERKIDIPADQFPSIEQLDIMEAPLTDNGCQHGWFDSVHNKLQLHYRKFLPKNNNPRGIVIFMHGLQSQSGVAYVLHQSEDDPRSPRRVDMALLSHDYVQQGFAVYAFDLIGHGYSEGNRHVMPSARVLIQDYVNFVHLVTSFHPPNTPLFLAGESLGGNLTLHVARYFQDHPEQTPPGFQGMVLFSPAIFPHTMYAPIQFCLWLLVTLLPFFRKLRPPSCIPSPVAPHRIWSDPERIELGKRDNVVVPKNQHPPYQTLHTLCVLMRQVRAQIIPGLTVPFCVVHGAKDLAIPVVGVEFLLQTASTHSNDCAHQIYPEALHDLLAEPEAEDVVKCTIDWIHQRLCI